MDYTQLTEHDVAHMLATIGMSSVDELFAGIPAGHRVNGLLDIPDGLAEPELLQDVHHLAGRNVTTHDQISFLGAGIYERFIPTLVDSLAMQSEFLTAYTPYQAEASQGTLQAFFEFQTMVCQLTGMDVANASLYEASSAAAEAMFMAQAVTRREQVVVAGAVHPDHRAVLQTYTAHQNVTRSEIAPRDGVTPLDAIEAAVDDSTMAIIVQQPNFFGNVEDLPACAEIAHRHGALLIVVVDPISCGLLKSPGACGADIVVGEGQGLGIPQSYGGPILGLMACRSQYMRRMPGRLVGQTVDRDGRQTYCLTLQTREQHIRREKATSNVCTNQGLLAMRAVVYMSTMGPQGISTVARQSFDKAHYAAERIAEVDGFELAFEAPFFQEFAVRATRPVADVMSAARDAGILAGVPLGRWYADLADCFLVAVTERRTRSDIDSLVDALKAG